MKLLLTSAALIVACAAPAFARQPAAAMESTPFSKGQTEFAALIAVGSAMDVWGGVPDNGFLTVGFRVGQVLTHPVGPGFLRGNFELSGELYPATFFRESNRTTYAFSGAIMMRHYLAPRGRIRPFLAAGAGAIASTRPIPRDISRVNFTPQGGAGIAVPLATGAVLTAEYRLHHMSDAALTRYNPGANSNELQIGISWVR